MGWLSRKINRYNRYLTRNIVVPVVEASMRLRCMMDKDLYSEQRRLLSLTEGKLTLKSKKYVVFVLYPKTGVGRYTRTIIEAIKRSEFNLLIVVNYELTPKDREILLGDCQLLLERKNLGRDFGAYKDGLSVLRSKVTELERVVIMNDSVYYLDNDLDSFLKKFDGDDDVIGLTETKEYHYHIQSFLISFSGRVFYSRVFQEYWRDYRPVSTRRWAIHKGEVKLTRILMRAGFNPNILYHAAQLKPFMLQQGPQHLLKTLKLLPTHWRRVLEERMSQTTVPAAANLDQIIPLLTIKPANQAKASMVPVEVDLQKITDILDHFNFIPSGISRDWIYEKFVDELIATIAQRNQIHLGGFLYAKFLGMPILKRDIVYREVYNFDQVYEILTDMDEKLKDDIISDLRQKGIWWDNSAGNRLLLRYGVI